jgi:predicted lipid-binding transport protein (Tim44 family)
MSMPAHTGPAAMATELSGAGVDRAFFGIRLFGSRRSGRRAWGRGRSGSYGYARRGRGGAPTRAAAAPASPAAAPAAALAAGAAGAAVSAAPRASGRSRWVDPPAGAALRAAGR